MLSEIARCLDLVSPEAGRADYLSAIVERNILGKRTEATRRESFRRLRELYSLDPATPLFGVLRSLDAGDPTARPLLALLIVTARDPLLRATIPTVLGAHEGDSLGAEDFDAALEQAFPRHLKEKTRAATARHIASSWSQSGHLCGRSDKKRTRVSPRPATITLALLMGTLQEVRGPELFTTDWCRILDLNADQARTLATQAHREGLLDLHAIGNIVEITFPRFSHLLANGTTREPL